MWICLLFGLIIRTFSTWFSRLILVYTVEHTTRELILVS